MRGCRLCRFPADLPKERPRFCVLCWNRLPVLQPARAARVCAPFACSATMNAPHLPRQAPSALCVIVTAMLLVAACFGVLEAVGRAVAWWRGVGP